MMALDVPNFLMWSKRQNSCSSPLLLTTSWVSCVDLSNRTPSQGDDVQGANVRTLPSGTRALQGWTLRIPLPLRMAPEFSRDRRVRDRATIGEWHRKNTEWVRYISWVDAEAPRAIGRRFHSWAEYRCMHDQTTTHECILMQAALVTFLDHRYFFDFLLSIFFWASLKNLFVFQTKDQKYHSSFCSRFEKNPCYSFSWKSVFCNTFVFSCVISKTFCHFCVFNLFFLWNYFVSLCFCPKEKWLILFTFSLHSSSSWFVLSSCVLSLCLLSLLLLFQLTKIWFKKKLVFYYSSSHNFPEQNDKNIVSSFRKDLPFLLFSILFHSRKAFFANKHVLSVFSLCISLSQKLSQQKKP